MTQLRDDCFAFGGNLMTVREALDGLRARIRPIPRSQDIDLRDADGRILADDLAAATGSPPADNSAVDGYALRSEDLNANRTTILPITGRAATGRPLTGAWQPGSAVRIFTGAVIPPGCDSVVMQEDTTEADGAVSVPPGLKRGANLRKAHEDFAPGTVLLRRGRRLRPQDIGLAAAAGRPRVTVYDRLRVALFSTGDELREPGQPLEADAIYDANRFVLRGLIERMGCRVTDLGILEDNFGTVRDALAAASAEHDLIITSGGVSVGEEDHVRAAVEDLGSIHSWRLAIKPGRPIALGQVGHVPFLGLPGNPVAAMVCFFFFGRPLILGLAGATIAEPRTFSVRMGFAHDAKPGRREWLRASLERDHDGQWVARRFRSQGSGVLSSMVDSDGLLVVPEETTALAPGDMVDFLPFSEVLG